MEAAYEWKILCIAGISGNDKSLGNGLWKGNGKWQKTVIRHPVAASIIL